MKTRPVYLDTSAYLPLLLNQPAAPVIQGAVRGVIVFTSVILFLEAHRNLIRFHREKAISDEHCQKAVLAMEEDMTAFKIREVTMDLCYSNQFPAISLPKSFDLIHLRTAVWFKEKGEPIRFLSLDRRQLDAARQLQLDVIEL